MLGAAEDIVRRGGQRGIGCVLVSQRSAVLNKNVLTQAQILVVLRTIAPQDLAAMKAWIDVHGDEAQGRGLMDSLPSLPVGDAWIWSPGWPTTDGIFKRVHVLSIETFDSGATPKPGETRREPKQVADVDLEALKRQMATTIERAKADDPRELRKQLAELKKQLTERGHSTSRKADVPPPKVVEKFVLKDGQLARAEKLLDHIEKLHAGFREQVEALVYAGKELEAAITKTRQPIHPAAMTTQTPRSSQESRVAPALPPATRRRPALLVSDGPSGAEQRILDAVEWWRAADLTAPSRHQVAFVAGYTVNGHFNNLVGGLRSKGLIDYPAGGGVTLTEEGLKRANVNHDEVVTREALVEKVLAVLDPSPGRIFKAVVDAGRDLTREELAQLTGYTVNGHFNNMVGSLRSLGVIDYPSRGGVTLGRMFDALS
jgi:hypothetical protein